MRTWLGVSPPSFPDSVFVVNSRCGLPFQVFLVDLPWGSVLKSGVPALRIVPEFDVPTEPIVFLDDTNVRLLGELHANPRITMSALGRRVGMSPPAVTERVQRLEQAGVILGHRLDVDPAALGLPVTPFVPIRPAPGQLPKIAELARRLGQVSACHRITGEHCFLVKVHAASVLDLEELLDPFLAYGQTVSSIVASTPVSPRPLPLPGNDVQD